jgi:oxalyl-CoA decarboxylase
MSTSTEATATVDTAVDLTDGYHLVVEALKLNDVRTIYGVVGIPITDVARVAQASGIHYIGFRHESDAGHAAAAAGFLTKKPGICLTVSAPGFLNGLVALANATTNCFPMVQISGSSERHIVEVQRGDYEELDQLAAAKPFAKAAYPSPRSATTPTLSPRCTPTGSFNPDQPPRIVPPLLNTTTDQLQERNRP